MASKRLAWFATDTGKKWVLRGLSAIGGGLLFLNTLPQTFVLDKYRGVVQMYKLGIETPVSGNVVNLVNQVMDDMEIPQSERKLFAPFTVFGFDVFHAGSTTSRFGAIVGLPSNFAYESPKEVDRTNILVRNELVDWTSKPGRDLEEALCLSENAKKFAIGREICTARTIQPYLNGIYPVCVLVLLYSFTSNLNRRMKLFERPVAMRGFLYALTGLFGAGTWAFLQDASTVHYEAEADKKMCELGQDYIKGGIEFYSKTLQRNRALRELMGSNGEKLYSVTGNEKFFIRQKRLPIGHRKLYLEIRLKDLLKSAPQDDDRNSTVQERTSEDIAPDY